MTIFLIVPILSISSYLDVPVEYLTRRYQIVRNRH